MKLGRKRIGAAFLTVFALAAAAPAPRTADAAAADGAGRGDITLTVDLSERRLYVNRDGEVVESYAVAVGKPEHPTPRGTFSIRRMIWNPRWVPPDARWARKERPRAPGDPRNPMGRVKIFFSEPDYYIHGTRNVDSLGEAESHGCVRMRNSDVIALARMVMENGGAARSPGWFRQVINRVTSTREVRLSDPVRVTVRR